MPRISAFYGVVIYMYRNEKDHPVTHSTPTTRAGGHRWRLTGPCWRAAWHHVPRLLFSAGTVGDMDLSAERWTGVLEPLNDPLVTVDPESGTVWAALTWRPSVQRSRQKNG